MENNINGRPDKTAEQKDMSTILNNNNNIKNNIDSAWKKTIDIMTILFLGLTAIAAFLGWNIGREALKEYKSANNIQMINALLAMDGNLDKMMAEKPYLQAIFAEYPEDKDIKTSMNGLLNLFVEEKEYVVCENWKSIPELHDKLWEFSDFKNPTKEKLREAYFFAESILYLLLNAYIAKEFNLININEYETYAGYIFEVGHNPIFLCAICCGHKYGYITKNFAEELRSRLLSDQRIKQVINEVYPDMLEDKWINCIGREK